MIFYNENNKVINHKVIEHHEQFLADKLILENDCVLELGARYGTVSCTINNKLINKDKQVVIEPDDRVWEALENNKKINNCNFNIVKGFLSNSKLDLTNTDDFGGYGTTFIENNDTKISSYTMSDIKIKYNIDKFNVLVADCEGFLEVFFNENPTFYDDLRLIIFEADCPEKCNYEKIRYNLKIRNFRELLHGHQNAWIRDV